MVLIGITIGIALVWGWYYWSVRHFRLSFNVNDLIETGKTVQMAMRLALECIAQQRYPDARFHIDTAKKRHQQFTPCHAKTKKGADILVQEIVILEMVLHYAKEEKYNDAGTCVLYAANKHGEFLAYTTLLKQEMDEYE
jgi:hypothetical protein